VQKIAGKELNASERASVQAECTPHAGLRIPSGCTEPPGLSPGLGTKPLGSAQLAVELLRGRAASLVVAAADRRRPGSGRQRSSGMVTVSHRNHGDSRYLSCHDLRTASQKSVNNPPVGPQARRAEKKPAQRGATRAQRVVRNAGYWGML